MGNVAVAPAHLTFGPFSPNLAPPPAHQSPRSAAVAAAAAAAAANPAAAAAAVQLAAAGHAGPPLPAHMHHMISPPTYVTTNNAGKWQYMN